MMPSLQVALKSFWKMGKSSGIMIETYCITSQLLLPRYKSSYWKHTEMVANSLRRGYWCLQADQVDIWMPSFATFRRSSALTSHPNSTASIVNFTRGSSAKNTGKGVWASTIKSASSSVLLEHCRTWCLKSRAMTWCTSLGHCSTWTISNARTTWNRFGLGSMTMVW